MSNSNILIATQDVDDARLISEMLSREFDNIAVSTDSGQAVQDFEAHNPAVLILAFSSLAQAQAYYLGLYRLSSRVHQTPHKTLILCNKRELEQVYALCKQGFFSNYILFWPLGYDSTRLPMEVHHALRQFEETSHEAPSAGEFATQARRLAYLENTLEHTLDQGSAQLDNACQSLDQADATIARVLKDFAGRLDRASQSGMDQSGIDALLARLALELQAMQRDQIDTALNDARESVAPLRQWNQRLKQQLEPGLTSIRVLGELSDTYRPLVLIVDDDDFQHKLLRRVLAQVEIELAFASSGNDALTFVHRRRPDLILMDVGLPDIDGIETTRRLKSVPRLAGIPVVMLTGQGQKDVVLGSSRAGAQDFIVKPIEKAVLLKKLNTLLQLTD